MLLTHCVMGWIVLTVVSLCLPVLSAVKVIQPYSVISTNGTAQIQCFVLNHPSYHQAEHSIDQNLPDFGPEKLRVTLLRGLHGTQEICSFIPKSTGQQEPSEKEGKVQCSAQLTEGTVEVTVSGLKSTDTDMYRCEIEFFYPPPYLRLFGNGTLIHVLERPDCPMSGAHSQTAQQRGEEEDAEHDAELDLVSVPVVTLVILVICVMVIIIFLQVHQCERGRREVVRPVPSVHKVDAVAFSCDNII